MDISSFARKYVVYLNDCVQATSDAAIEALPDVLKKPGFAIVYSDTTDRHMLYLISQAKTDKIVVNGEEIRHHNQDGCIFISLQRAVKPLEQFLFPNVSEETSKASITVSTPDFAIKGVAFADSEYDTKYWSQDTFPRWIGDLPFRVVRTGSLLGLDLLHGLELQGVRHDNLIEFLLVYGSKEMIPEDEDDIRDAAFRAFSLAAFRYPADEGNKVSPAWSFTGFLRSLEGPVQKNVLLLGPYSSEEDFYRLKEVLRSFGYNGFMLKDSPDVPIQSNVEKLHGGIMCSCFVIVLDTEPSGHLAELHALLSTRWRPVIVIRRKSDPASFFLEDKTLTDEYFKVAIIPEISESTLLPYIKWAKGKTAMQIKNFNRINPWRGKDNEE